MIIRTKKTDKYTVISNAGLNDSRLSLRARGLYAYLLSKPNNWEISVKGLYAQLKEGRDAIRAVIKELEDAGYLRKNNVRNEKGQFSQDLVLAENPLLETRRGQPDTVNPTQVSTNKLNTEIVSTNNSTNVELARAGKPDINEMFDYWLEATGLPIVAEVRRNRYACNNLLKKHGPEKLRQLINAVAVAQGDQFAPRIADFRQLQAKLNDLMVWGKKRTVASKGVKL